MFSSSRNLGTVVHERGVSFNQQIKIQGVSTSRQGKFCTDPLVKNHNQQKSIT
uniref:Uncharacterized protein n=1 Tax=Rhizophora mucronata TaxID=61149 RepID=A0A2P2JAA8_RHIMU